MNDTARSLHERTPWVGSLEFAQDSHDGCDEDCFPSLTIKACNNGAGPFPVITAEAWGTDDIDELCTHLRLAWERLTQPLDPTTKEST